MRIEVDFIDSEGRIVSTGQGHAVRVDPSGIYLTATHVVLPSRSALEHNHFITTFTIRLPKGGR